MTRAGRLIASVEALSRRRSGSVLLAVIIVLLLVRIAIVGISTEPNRGDANQYVGAGIHLARTGEFGYRGEQTMFIEPLLSTFVAAQVRIDPRLQEALTTGSITSGRAHRAVKQQNLLWAGLLLAGIGVQTRLIASARTRDRSTDTGRTTAWLPVASVIAVAITFLDNPEIVDLNLVELPSAAMVVWVGVFATRLVLGHHLAWAAVLGVSIGVLSLTRATFFYLGLVFIVVLMSVWAARTRQIGKALTTLVVAALCVMVVVGPWMVRNQVVFDRFDITERGGTIMWIRALKNDMTPLEWRAAWIWWGPPPMEPILSRILGVPLGEFDEGGEVSRLNRDLDVSYYRTARRERSELAAAFQARGHTEGAPLADEVLLGEAIDRLLNQPWKTLRTLPVFMWRSAWPMDSTRLLPGIVMGPINLAGLAVLIGAAVVAVIRRRPLLFAVVGLPAGMYMFNAILSHALFRYSRPAAPTIVMLLVIGVWLTIQRPAVVARLHGFRDLEAAITKLLGRARGSNQS